MFDHIESFHRPSSVTEAIALWHDSKGKARFLAGGTGVIVQADRSIRSLIDISLLGLNYIQQQDGGCVIGATTTLSAIENADLIQRLADGILVQAAAGCGPVQKRNRATLGGQLATVSPNAEIAPALLALEAVAILARPRRNHVPLAQYFSETDQNFSPGALLIEVVIPAQPAGSNTGWSLQKIGRTTHDAALVTVATGLQLDRSGHCQSARIALGGVERISLRAVRAEEALVGHKLDRSLIEEAGSIVAQDVSPLGDVRASAKYRRDMSGVLTRRALLECAVRAGHSL